MCRAQELGSYAQGQGHNQVRGQIVPEVVLLVDCWGGFGDTLRGDGAWWEGVSRPWFGFLHPGSGSRRSGSCLGGDSKTAGADLGRHHGGMEHNEKVCHAQGTFGGICYIL